ncbi:MAG: hypothetical protein KJO34_16285 [Deltaproteobacteria bacterium]|nr:hypothetical protein [Deltaproteobacteria bacterium]
MMNKCVAFLIPMMMMVSCATSQVDQKTSHIDPSRPHIVFTLVYNFEVYQKPSFFLSKSYPTYAIWLKEKSMQRVMTVYVTGKAGKGEWVMADSRPESVPVWYGIKSQEEAKSQLTVDAISGATPSGEAAEIVWQVPENLVDKKIDIYIEANSSFDYNDYYKKQKGDPGYSGANGQPSLIWHALLDLSESTPDAVTPEIVGHGHVLGLDHQIDPDISKITTASETFQYIGIKYVKN